MNDMKHSELSASRSMRWIHCAGSIKAEAGLPDRVSSYSLEGTIAHRIAAKMLDRTADYDEIEKEILRETQLSLDDLYNEMLPAIRVYTSYIDMFRSVNDRDFHIEKQVDYSTIAPGSFGTADAISIYDDTLHIFDFKYGKGVMEEARHNTQLLLYAIGAYNEFYDTHTINRISLHIIQPRMNNIDIWNINMKELAWWEGYIKAKAEAALSDNAPRNPHIKACRWCKAAPTCPALYNFVDSSVTGRDAQKLEDDHVIRILENEDMIIRFINAVKDHTYNRLLQGIPVKGFKLTEGITRRRVKDSAATTIVELLGDSAFKKTLIGVGELEKLVDASTLESLVETYRCKPSMVPENSSKPPMIRPELQF